MASSQSNGQDNQRHETASQEQLTKLPGSLQPGKEVTEGTKKTGMEEVVYRIMSPMEN